MKTAEETKKKLLDHFLYFYGWEESIVKGEWKATTVRDSFQKVVSEAYEQGRRAGLEKAAIWLDRLTNSELNMMNPLDLAKEIRALMEEGDE